MGRQGPEIRGDGLVKEGPLFGEGFQGWAGGLGVPVGREGVGPGGVQDDQDHIGPIGLGLEINFFGWRATEGDREGDQKQALSELKPAHELFSKNGSAKYRLPNLAHSIFARISRSLPKHGAKLLPKKNPRTVCEGFLTDF